MNAIDKVQRTNKFVYHYEVWFRAGSKHRQHADQEALAAAARASKLFTKGSAILFHRESSPLSKKSVTGEGRGNLTNELVYRIGRMKA